MAITEVCSSSQKSRDFGNGMISLSLNSLLCRSVKRYNRTEAHGRTLDRNFATRNPWRDQSSLQSDYRPSGFGGYSLQYLVLVIGLKIFNRANIAIPCYEKQKIARRRTLALRLYGRLERSSVGRKPGWACWCIAQERLLGRAAALHSTHHSPKYAYTNSILLCSKLCRNNVLEHTPSSLNFVYQN